MGYAILRERSLDQPFQPVEPSSWFSMLFGALVVGFLSNLLLTVLTLQVREWLRAKETSMLAAFPLGMEAERAILESAENGLQEDAEVIRD
jgi:hypothetical protein